MSKRNKYRPVVVKQAAPPTPTALAVTPNAPFSAGGRNYASIDPSAIKGDFLLRERLMDMKARSIKRQTRQANNIKTAGLFNEGELSPANIVDSNNIGMYSYEFPVDSLEMPQSRPEELRFYRLAYDRDPIVGRAIDLHSELPVSKMQLEKPKCSVETFADYVFDYFQRLVNDTQLFQLIIEATREYHAIGEAYLYVIQPDDFKDVIEGMGEEAKEAVSGDKEKSAGTSPATEAENAPVEGRTTNVTEDWLMSKKKVSKLFKQAASDKLFTRFTNAGIEYEDDDFGTEGPAKLAEVKQDLKGKRAEIISLIKQSKVAAKLQKTASMKKLALPGDPPPPAPDAGAGAPPPGDAPPPDPGMDGGMPPEEGGVEDDMGGMDDGMGGMPMGGGGGGGGFGGGMDADPMQADGAEHALSEAATAARAEEISELKRYIHLLERKKELLEELKELVEQKRLKDEIFAHVTNKEYEGFERIQMLAPEKIELATDESMGPEPMVMYKPTETEKQALLESENIDTQTSDVLEEKGQMRLNTDPMVGPFVIHFARKKAGYELHGRSMLQRCMRTLIYREKLRQVQTTLASRNMTPKTVITAPGVSEVQVLELRAQADEAKADPDFTIVTNYELTWNEISSQGRLLQLSDEYQHLNSDLAIGLGFTPEILIGEGMYGGNRIALELLNTTYSQYRETLSDIVENKLFKPIAMLKGFFEMDDYGRPRWIYPKLTFSRLALRDSSDTFDILFNLYSKGSLPVATLFEFLNIDPESARRDLEDDLFSVSDSRMNDGLTAIYNTVAQAIVERTDVVSRITKGLMLEEQEAPDPNAIEGSGEGI